MAKKNKQSASYFGGMTFKEFRNANKVGLWMNDVAWAGRLYTKYPYWWEKLSKVVYIMLALSVLSLVLIWGSILLRPPVLLLGVYPDGRVVCMPRILDENGNRVIRHSSYNSLCGTLFNNAGLSWVLEESKKNGGQMPSTDPSAEKPDPNPDFAAPVTTLDYLDQRLLDRQMENTRSAVETFVPLTTNSPPPAEGN